MEISIAVSALSALAQPSRLAAFRLLVEAGPAGLAAGEIAARLDLPPATLSFHLSRLEQADLVTSVRRGRRIVYAANFAAMTALMAFLTENCCGGDFEACTEGPPNPTPADPAPADPASPDSASPDPIPADSAPPDLAPATPSPAGAPAQRPAEVQTDKIYDVLFLCTGNSARSIMAEGILARLGAGRFRAFSAGSHPKGVVHPAALALLRGDGYAVDDHAGSHKVDSLRSKSWDEFAGADAPQMDFVFTVCDTVAGEVCPAWPGQPMTAHWGLPDPAAAQGSEAERRLAFAEAYRCLVNRISIFINLPVASLDRLSLKRRLDAIGRPGAPKAPGAGEAR